MDDARRYGLRMLGDLILSLGSVGIGVSGCSGFGFGVVVTAPIDGGSDKLRAPKGS